MAWHTSSLKSKTNLKLIHKLSIKTLLDRISFKIILLYIVEDTKVYEIYKRETIRAVSWFIWKLNNKIWTFSLTCSSTCSCRLVVSACWKKVGIKVQNYTWGWQEWFIEKQLIPKQYMKLFITFCWIFSWSCSVAVWRASLRAAIRISLSLL